MTAMSDPIANLRSPGGSLISVYVDRPSPGGFGALLSDLVKPIRERSEDLARAAQMSVRSDTSKIHDLADRLEVDSAPAYAIFASDVDEIFILEPLAQPSPNVSTVGPRPYMRPLRAAPRALRSGVIVADRSIARTFVGFNGVVEEIGSSIEVDFGKSNYGGFSGYEERGNRSYADEASNRLWKEAGWRLLEEHQSRSFDYIAVGGHEETVDEIARSLHPYLSRLPRASFTCNPQAPNPTIFRSEIRELDEEIRRNRQEALAGRVCDTAWSGGNAVLGLTATLEAVNAQAIDTLVVAGDFTRSGSICNQCGHLARDQTSCPVCGAEMFDAEDLVAAVMDATVSAGGRVFQVGVASPLDVSGIGALTRFPVAV